MWMTKYQSNYINTLAYRHGYEIHINSNGFKRHDRFKNNVMFEFSWNVTSKIKYEQLERIVETLRNKVSRIIASGPWKRFITGFSKIFK